MILAVCSSGSMPYCNELYNSEVTHIIKLINGKMIERAGKQYNDLRCADNIALLKLLREQVNNTTT